MIRNWICGLLLAASLVCGQRPAAVPVRVLTYNIHAGVGVDGRFDLERIAGVIRGASPDVVALQEVDRNTKRSGGLDVAAELGRLTGMHAAFGKAMDYGGGEYGVAVLARGEIASTKVHAIGNSPGHEPRVILETAVRVRDVPLRVFATHFDHQSAQDRKRGAELAVKLGAQSDVPAIFAGDLNAVPDAAELAPLKEGGWRPAGEGQSLLTIPVGTPRRQIDYILYRPAERWKVTSAEVVDEKVASDHRPLFVVLELSSK